MHACLQHVHVHVHVHACMHAIMLVWQQYIIHYVHTQQVDIYMNGKKY